MSKENDGGPAYPCADAYTAAQGFTGMSLRDWFAGQALNLLAASLYVQDHPLEGVTPAGTARGCYAIADAMLAEREKGGGK